MVRTKVFVGNLSFEITESELLAEFSNSGKVISANIITRGPRSLGYGFVEMDSEEDAKKAVDAMHKKEIKGRQINVEVAKPQDETKKPQPKSAPADGENADAAPQRRQRRRPAKTTGPKGEVSEEGRAPKPRNRRPAQEGESDDAAVKKTRAPRPPRNPAPKRTPTEPREESKTTLFVANLPFSFTDDEFAKILTEKQLKLKSAHVVSKKNGKSKGYGFVEFDNQEDQQKALNALHKITVDNRELSVKVALTESKNQEEDKQAAEKPTGVAAEKKPTVNNDNKKTNSPAEKKTNQPAEKRSTPNAEKKTAAPEKKTENAEKKTQPAEKKTTPVAEKKTATPEKK
jgi:RNA recognition motif-containing protein